VGTLISEGKELMKNIKKARILKVQRQKSLDLSEETWKERALSAK
jgi:hypothetical protein